MARRREPVVPQRMLEAIQERGLTNAQVAKALAVHEGTVSRWLSGDRTPEYYLLEEFAHLVGKRPETFLRDAESVRQESGMRDVLAIFNLAVQGETPDLLPALKERFPQAPIPKEACLRLQRQGQTAGLYLRQLVRENLGREWEELSDAERLAFVDELALYARARGG